MGAAAIPLMIVSTAMSAYGAYQQGQYQGGVARNNAVIQEQNATWTKQQGIAEEANQRQKTAQMAGGIQAEMAGHGVDTENGTPLRLQGDVANLGETDAITIRNNAMRKAWGFDVAASGNTAQAAQDTTAGNLDAFTSLIGGASSISRNYKSSPSGLNATNADYNQVTRNPWGEAWVK